MWQRAQGELEGGVRMCMIKIRYMHVQNSQKKFLNERGKKNNFIAASFVLFSNGMKHREASWM